MYNPNATDKPKELLDATLYLIQKRYNTKCILKKLQQYLKNTSNLINDDIIIFSKSYVENIDKANDPEKYINFIIESTNIPKILFKSKRYRRNSPIDPKR